ncbi:hypothetical protein BpHYR1_041898 [Brachionus plicatilis]|uniref:Uncharacterized protein n=1 Tax=Brachionus plicatilis TaxID=10195 RepID=A0A3M7S1R7_BRAPC|nr:hypothetical protein BpHYR1_041898 [Brachionus plicatilis]
MVGGRKITNNYSDNIPSCSNKISHIHWHFVNLSAVVLFNVSQYSDVIIHDKIDGDTLAAKAARAAYSVNVELAIVGQVVVDHQRHLLHVDASGPHVRRDQHSAHATSELFHDRISFRLFHVPVHRGHPFVQHFVGLVQNQQLYVSGLQVAPMNHVNDPARRARHNVLPIVQLFDVVSQTGSADASVTLHSPSANTTCWICTASSRVGDSTRACVSLSRVSIICSVEMANVAVLPVPDCDWAMTSRPDTIGTMARCWMADGFSKP